MTSTIPPLVPALLLLCAFAILPGARAQPPAEGGGRITVSLSSLEGADGTILCGLFRESDAEGFPMSRRDAWKSARRAASSARDARMTLVFDEVPAGRYAVSCMHDEDDDGAMDTGIFGIPKEGWAVSRNASPSMRAPRFDEAVVDYDGSATTLRLRMQY
ncbi:MAG: DUF2141 domain-containing protein [Sandaracinus sp.]|nr:DUF2141 domain-containing protein [Sandaracinus sp.]MCB9633106.1 DUF2141 domain-containing protein [Sandaracinus sp.]